MVEDFKRMMNGNMAWLQSCPFGVAILKGQGSLEVTMANRIFFAPLGYSQEEGCAKGELASFCATPEDRDTLRALHEESMQGKEPVNAELRFIGKNGGICWMKLCICQLGQDGQELYFLAASWDINDRKQMEDEMRLQMERYQLIMKLVDEMPVHYEVGKDYIDISEEMANLHHFPSTTVTLEELTGVIDERDRTKFLNVVKRMKESEAEGIIEYRVKADPNKGKAHSWHRTHYKSILGPNGNVTHIIGSVSNIDKEKRIYNRLQEKARRDPMTQLLNKQALKDEIQDFFSEKPQGIQAFMVIDIDNFKKINDQFGHIYGDTIIKEVAEKITAKFRGLDIIGRVGGDEFVVCMKYTTVEHAMEKAKSLCESVRKNYQGNRLEYLLTCSIGISFYGMDGIDYDTLFRKADMAMYQAKTDGKDGYQVTDQKVGLQDVPLPEGEANSRDGDYGLAEGRDQDFLTYTFELLSKAKDINGSINNLLERIGKRYQLNMVLISEDKGADRGMVVTNCWASNAAYLRTDFDERHLDVWEEHKGDGKALVGDCTSEELSEADRQAFREYRIRSYAKYHYGERGKPKGYITFCDCDVAREWTDFEEQTFAEIVRMVSVFVMLRAQKEKDQAEIKSLQSNDPLTGLYNFETFKKKAEKILRISEPKDTYAFICADMSGFSYLNEHFGYGEGNEVLMEIGQYIQSIPGVTLACRRYADLFFLMVKTEGKNHCIEEAIIRSSEFQQSMKQKYPNGNLYESLGIYFWSRENYDIEEFIENANLARKEAKKDQEFWLKVYTDQMKEERNRERIIAASFYPALGHDEFEIYLQPKFLLDEWKVYGAEALARWRRLDGKYHNPDDFIPVLEKLGYINDLDFYIFEEAARSLRKWNDDGKPPLIISTNFSGQHFKDPSVDFVQKVCEITDRYGVPNSQLEIEITESVAVQELNKLGEILEKLRGEGFRIAIDDFGTGYSSLNILFDIPVDVVKIDKSFLNAENFEKRKQLIMHIGEMVRLADEEILFEGVENQEQVDFLLESGYRYGQGYIFGKPMHVSDFERKYIY